MTGDQLRNSILQMAVQGKLVPQDPNDEPASVLLDHIYAEKEKLIKEGKIKKEKNPSRIFRGADNLPYEKIGKNEPVCIAEEIPFEIPDSWEWVRLNEICEYIQRGRSPKYSPIKKYPVIAQKCNQWSGFSIEKAQFIDPESISTYGPERILQDYDLMWNSTGLGTLGRMAIYKTEANPYELAVADSHVTVIRPLKTYVKAEYLYYYFANPTVQNVIEKQSDIFRRDNSYYEISNKKERCIDEEIPFEIPYSWSWARIESLFQINPRNNIPDETIVGFMPMSHIKAGFTNSFEYEEKLWKDVKSGFTHFADNDIIIAKISPCFQNRKSAIVHNLPSGYGAGTTELHVLRDCTNLLYMPFFLLIFKSCYFIQSGTKEFTGTAGQQRIGKNFMSKYLVPVPPYLEQKRIVKKMGDCIIKFNRF